jgi:hypothetical protein
MELNDEEKKWLSDSLHRNQKSIDSSAIFLSLYTSEYQKDPVAVMQFGLAILKDKPIYILCHKGQQLCENVKRVAKYIEYFDPNDIDDLKKKTEALVEKAQKDVMNAK